MRENIIFSEYFSRMATISSNISGRKDFSPLIVRIENNSVRPMKVRLFDAKFRSQLINIKLKHPEMAYLTLCSMLERVQLKVNRTMMKILKGTEQQLQQSMQLLAEDAAGAAIQINWNESSRWRATGTTIATDNTFSYRIGPAQRMPLVHLQPKTIIELSFFIPGGLVPAEKKEWHAKTIAQ